MEAVEDTTKENQNDDGVGCQQETCKCILIHEKDMQE